MVGLGGLAYLLNRLGDAARMKALREVATRMLPTSPWAPPPLLARPTPRLFEWSGGYVSHGMAYQIPGFLKLLRDGHAVRAVVLEASHTTDSDGMDYVFAYAFRDAGGTLRVIRKAAGIDTTHAALSSRSGQLSEYFDLDPHVGMELVVLVDPAAEDHVIYDALFVDEASVERSLRPKAPWPVVVDALPVATVATRSPNEARPVKQGPHTLEDLFDAVAANPDDDGPLLVLADALLERGLPQGEFIALDLKKDARGKVTGLARHRHQELFSAHSQDWTPPKSRGNSNRETERWQRRAM
jgi:uncharacterized protein (TIGR02996 family)